MHEPVIFECVKDLLILEQTGLVGSGELCLDTRKELDKRQRGVHPEHEVSL